ncbi:MAG: T9SS type A sorting domain-containing protein, partial [Rhodothermales bacterium]|nr:T9SS type A sorting domain-containing protein [Rhodothermales bacterium]
GGSVTFEADVQTFSAELDTVILHVQTASFGSQSYGMTPAGAETFSVPFDLPTTPDSVRYWVEARDEEGFTGMIPDDAPGNRFVFGVGEDRTAPSIEHVPIEISSILAWPERIEAVVTDNIGVGRVDVEYEVEGPDGALIDEGTFELEPSGADFGGLIPTPVDQVRRDAVVRYRITAVDQAVGMNRATMPALGIYEFTIGAEGLLREFRFESGPGTGVTLTGSWETGAPEFGLLTAYGGGSAAGTDADAPTSATPGISMLRLPTLNLSGIAEARLTFVHWFDTEHDGTAGPESSSATLFDGGNVKISTDGGANWSVLEPVTGSYTGTLDGSSGNPMAGQRAFGGYGFGWRLAEFELPEAPSVAIRLDFGTDLGNTRAGRDFAGWFVDNIRVTTEEANDTEPPVVGAEPALSDVRSTQSIRPVVQVDLTDDSVVTDVFLEYDYEGGAGGAEFGVVRMEMRPESTRLFEGVLEAISTPSPGDVLTYTIVASDAFGNSILLPESGGAYEIEFRLIDELDMLADVTASGRWRFDGAIWTIMSSEGEPPVSSLNVTAVHVPTNALRARLEIAHDFQLLETVAANVKVSVDDGRNWLQLEPDGGYDGPAPLPATHPMSDDRTFSGLSGGAVVDRFDLSEHAGRRLLVRYDFGSTSNAETGDYWSLETARILFETTESAFEVDRATLLHPVYPNPSRSRAHVSVTLKDRRSIQLEVFDLLGRRVSRVDGGTRGPGTHSFTLDTVAWAAGVYVVRLVADGRDYSTTLVVAK